MKPIVAYKPGGSRKSLRLSRDQTAKIVPINCLVCGNRPFVEDYVREGALVYKAVDVLCTGCVALPPQ